MLFEYHGLNNDGLYVRGFVRSNDLKSAIRKLKTDGTAEVVMSIKKSVEIESVVKFRTKYIESLADSENKSRERKLKSELKKIEKMKKKLGAKDQGVPKKDLFKNPFKKKRKNEIEDLSKESIKKLQEVFKKNDNFAETNFDEKVIEYEKTLQLEEKVMNKLRGRIGEKEINWDLLNENKSTPTSKERKKLKVKPAEIFLFTKRLHIMLSSGITLLAALRMLRDTTTPSFAKILEEVITMIESGSTFSEAISHFPKQFNNIFVALISVGESSGSLERCLLDILEVQEQQLLIRKKIKSAAIYPAVIGVVFIAALVLGSVYFIPTFEEMFTEQGMDLPILTKVVFAIADAMPLIFGVGIAALVAFISAKNKNPAVDKFWKKHFHKILLKAPIISKVNNANYMFTFSSTIALMLNNGISLKDTLSLAYRAINNVYVKNDIISASGLMIKGNSFSESLSKQESFDKILVNIVQTGEESGRLSFALNQIAKYFKEDLERQINIILELIQPLSMLLVGLLVGPVIIAVYLPILDMSSGALM